MDDRNLMENLLMLEKGACDLFMHGAIESATDSVHNVFSTALNSALGMQDSIYSKMSEKGWYPMQQVQQNAIDGVKQKFSQQQSC